MANCQKIVRKSKRVCIGSLNKKIDIELRQITPPIGGNVDFGESFTLVKTVWAMVETIGHREFFDNTNTMRVKTHHFYIRYIPNVEITAENWVKYNSEYYDILGVQDLNEEHRFYLLEATVRGTTAKPVNFN